ncbi:Hypothetical_protein [Hexamita inflata]|uniref:Hypothetical_protein n=1 Tax=Hexamita inflata TaxID=28002 RepID=A0AA86RJY3_9EUKA|nr:Hypothetical protein HINF_LOCUS63868 [Hexamita inflata]
MNDSLSVNAILLKEFDKIMNQRNKKNQSVMCDNKNQIDSLNEEQINSTQNEQSKIAQTISDEQFAINYFEEHKNMPLAQVIQNLSELYKGKSVPQQVLQIITEKLQILNPIKTQNKLQTYIDQSNQNSYLIHPFIEIHVQNIIQALFETSVDCVDINYEYKVRQTQCISLDLLQQHIGALIGHPPKMTDIIYVLSKYYNITEFGKAMKLKQVILTKYIQIDDIVIMSSKQVWRKLFAMYIQKTYDKQQIQKFQHYLINSNTSDNWPDL